MATVNGAAVAAVTAQAGASPSRIAIGTVGFPYHVLGVKVELLLNTTWTDITKYVLVRDDISISPFGRTDESSQMDASSLTMTLKNSDGRFTPDNTSGAYYPYVQLNTQIRLSISDVSATNVAYQGYRFWGEVSEWPPLWDPKAADVYCTITASGIWRRLSQRSKTIGSPYTRFNNSLNSTYNLAAYWPMEDGANSQSFATTTPSTAANMTISGPPTNVPTLSSVAEFTGSDALPTLNAAEFDGTVSTSSNPTTNQFRYCVFIPAGGDTGRGMSATLTAPAVIARMHTTGTVATVDVGYASPEAGGDLVIKGSSSGGTQLFTGHSPLNTWGRPMMVLVSLAQSGSNIIWTLNTIVPGGTGWNTTVTGSVSGTVDDVSSIIFNPGGTFSAASVGQAAVYYGNPPFSSTSNALNGWTGENAMTRFTRLCSEENIPVQTIGSCATQMGPQADDTLVNIFQEIETTDGGLIYETRNAFGLGYRSMASLQNQTVAATLDYAQQQVGQGLAPVNDDALTHNDVTLTNNYDGYAVRVYLANGARSLQNPPNGVGTGYESAITVNAYSDSQVNNLGIQLLNCGTFWKSRYPAITANLARVTTAGLFGTLPALRQGDYLQVTNMPAIGGSSTQKQLVWGWVETINTHTWTLAFNTIPEDPWESSFNPGTSLTANVPSSPTTQGGAGGSTVGSVSSAQIVEGAIIGQNIAQGAIQGGNIANATISATNIASATITGDNIAAATITGSNIASGTITGTNITNASITGTQIASGTITSTNIQAGTIIGSDIASGTITGTNIASATILGSNIGSATIQGSNIQNATITNIQIGTGTITGGTGGNLGSSTITGANIANATVTSVQIANGTITTTQISNSAGITGTQVASGTITASNIAANTITGSLIAANTIVAGNIAANTITTSQIAAATITGGNIAANTITATNIAASTITGGLIAAGTITATNIQAGTITATQIAAGTITSGKLASGIVVAGIVDATTITGASMVVDGSSGEFLVYAGTPASGNLIGSWSAVSGTDGNSNTYNAGIWAYDTSGNSIGIVPGGSTHTSYIGFTTGSGTPVPSSGLAALYGAGSGTVQVVDASDGEPYGTARRSLATTSVQTISSSSYTGFGLGSTLAAPSGTGRSYRVSGLVYFVTSTGTGTAVFNITPKTSGAFGGGCVFQWVEGTSTWCTGATAVNGGANPGIGPSTNVYYPCYVNGVITVPAATSGVFDLQCKVDNSGPAYKIGAGSYVDIMPI